MLESPWEELLHYGLLLGAAIQLIAILAIIVLPSATVSSGDDAALVKDVNTSTSNGTVVTDASTAGEEGQKAGAVNPKKSGKLKKRKRQ